MKRLNPTYARQEFLSDPEMLNSTEAFAQAYLVVEVPLDYVDAFPKRSKVTGSTQEEGGD